MMSFSLIRCTLPPQETKVKPEALSENTIYYQKTETDLTIYCNTPDGVLTQSLPWSEAIENIASELLKTDSRSHELVIEKIITQYNDDFLALLLYWLYYKKKFTERDETIGNIAYWTSLFSSISLVFLGASFLKRNHCPNALAFILGCATVIPLTLLISTNASYVCQKIFHQKSIVEKKLLKDPETQRIIRNFIVCFLAILPSYVLTYISHDQIYKASNSILNESNSLALAWISDVFSFFPRIFLFYMTLNKCIDEVFCALFSNSLFRRAFCLINKRSAEEALMVRNHLISITETMTFINDDQLNQLSDDHLIKKNLPLNRFFLIHDISSQYPDATRSFSCMVRYFIILSAILIACISSYTFKMAGDSAYPAIGITGHCSDFFAWLTALSFASLTYTAQQISVFNFYVAGNRIIQNYNSQRNNNLSGLIFPACILTLITVFSILSCFPRIEMNIQYDNGTIPKNLRVLFNVASGMSFFSLDFWPLHDLAQKCINSVNRRKDMILPTENLINILPDLKKEYINCLYDNIKKKNLAVELPFFAKEDTLLRRDANKISYRSLCEQELR